MQAQFNTSAGYCVPWVVHPGTAVALHASLEQKTAVDLVRVACANAERDQSGAAHGPAERIVPVEGTPAWTLPAATHALVPGVQFQANAASWPAFREAMLVLAVQWSGRGASGHVASFLDQEGCGLRFDLVASDRQAARLALTTVPGHGMAPAGELIGMALPYGDWLLLIIDQPPNAGAPRSPRKTMRLRSACCRPTVPGGVPDQWSENWTSAESLAGWRPSRICVGTLDATQLGADVRLDLLSWIPLPAAFAPAPTDFAVTSADDLTTSAWEKLILRADAPGCMLRGRIGTGNSIDDLTGAARVSCAQRPYTAVRGLRWDGRFHNPAQAPGHYSALHLNSDTMLDAHWPQAVRWRVPEDLPSGCYAFRLALGRGFEPEYRYAMFFVSAATRPKHRIAVLLPTFSYLAYSNATEEMRGPVVTPAPHAAEAFLDAVHPRFGRSLYERHPDGHGVLYCSSRRPMLSVSPGHRPWQFVADSWLLDWLETSGEGVDIVTDHDLHRAGEAVLSPYAVVVSGHHPEYWTTQMWDGLWCYLHTGGRLMYLGGNGLYWRTAFDDSADMVEVRRAEDGTRPSMAPPGEYHCAFTGEFGGLWRRLGRPPQQIVGVGMAAQGFERSGHYRKCPDSAAPEVNFVFSGVEGMTFGDSGWLGGGASGWEIDRIDVDLGTPLSHWWLARSDGHAPSMMRTKEELLSYIPPFRDAKARSDIALVAVGRGDVFAVGSMTWVGSLHSQAGGPSTDVATITANVLRRLQDPRPIPRKPIPQDLNVWVSHPSQPEE